MKINSFSNIKPLKPCIMCDKDEVIATYEKNGRYRYECCNCGQYFEFNAPSQMAADLIFNYIIRGNISEGADNEHRCL